AANKLILQCYSKAGVRSNKGEATVKCSREVSPRLFGLAIGVGDSTEMKLPGPKRFETVKQCPLDARRIQTAWQERARSAYIDPDFRCMCDKEVTPETVLRTIRSFVPKARPDDLFVLYLAGHGYADGILQR